LSKVSLLSLTPFSAFCLKKDTLKQKLSKKICEDFDSYLIQVFGSPSFQPEFGVSEREVSVSTPKPAKEMSKSVSSCWLTPHT
jgi:hypothetical protein